MATFDIFNIIALLGGLALFLYGMTLLGSGLEKVSGGRLEKILEKLTSNLFFSIALGALVTAAIQSSSATTVIVVGLVNSRILKLRHAIGVIMGANIGTTITAHILRLADIESSNFFLQIIKPTTLAPLMAIIGIVLFMSSGKNRIRELGQILVGFGILFTGMFNMEAAVRPLRDLPQFTQMFESFSNPIIGVLVGALVTAIVQSSSASVGILQALSSTGKITFSSAFPIIMGQNIGTCVTPLLASIGASKNAKRAAVVHVSFNIIGTIVFLIITYMAQSMLHFSFWDMAIDKGGIADFHTIFNIAVTLMFIPFVGALEKLACFIIKDNPDEADETDEVTVLDERFIISPGLALQYSTQTVMKMATLAKKNYIRTIGLMDKYDLKVIEKIKETEKGIDKLEDKVGVYLLKISQKELTDSESMTVSKLLHIISEFERIGDYSMNIMECIQTLRENKASFSPQAKAAMQVMFDAVLEIIELASQTFENNDDNFALNVEPLEQVIDDLEQILKNKHIERLKGSTCMLDSAFPFVEMLVNLERIADHCSNIAVYVISHSFKGSDVDKHQYLEEIHSGKHTNFEENYEKYSRKYTQKL